MQLIQIILRFTVLFSILVSVFASLSTSANNSVPSHLVKTITKINYFGIEHGLEQSTVFDLVQDRHGFLWLATQSGVVRFDGDKFRTFNVIQGGIAHNLIRTLFIDSKNRLWVGTENGLNRYDEINERFVSYNNRGLLDNKILSIYEDNNNRLWVSTGSAIHILREEGQKFEVLTFDINGDISLSPKQIMAIYQDEKGFIWLGAGREQNYLIDPLLNKLYLLEEENPLGLKIKNQSINQIIPYQNNEMLIISNREILKISQGRSIVLLKLQQQSEKLRRASFDAGGDLWVSSNEGISRYQLKDEKLLLLEHMSDSAAWSILKDKENTMWFGSHLKGLGQHTGRANYFKQFSAENNVLADNVVWSLGEDSHQNVWIAGNSSKLNKLNIRTREVSYFETKIEGGKTLALDKNGYIYIGSDQGLYRFDVTSEEFLGSKTKLSDKEVAYLTIHENHIYIGAWAEGLYRISLIQGDDQTHHRMLFSGKDIPYITTLISDNNMLYVGTLTGLLVIDSENDLFTEIQLLKNQRVSYVHVGKQGVYVSTGSDGVYLFSHDLTQLIKRYDKKTIKNSAIYSALSDEFGQLWMSTDNGIIKVNPNEKIEQFNLSDGLQGLDFNDNSALKGSDGNLYFGGVNGLNYIKPRPSGIINNQTPKLLFTEFSVFNKPVMIAESMENVVRLKQSIIHTPDITLNYSDYPFEFTFNLINYSQPDKVFYQYKIQGIDNDWIRSKDTKTATYTNLQFGHYQLEIEAYLKENGKKLASNKINIEILPPIWLSAMALSIYIMLLAIVAFVIFRVFCQRRQSAKALKLSAERLELSLWGSGDMMWDWDIVKDKMHLTKHWQQFDYEGLLDQKFSKIHPNDRSRVEVRLQKHLRGELKFFEANYRIKRKDEPEQWIWILDRAKVVSRSPELVPLRMTGTIRDITALKSAELTLNLQANVMAHISDAIYVLDLGFNVVEINKAFEKITGLMRVQVIDNQRIFSTYHGNVSQHVRQRLSSGLEWSGEVKAIKPSGDYYFIELNINPMRDDDDEISHYVAAFSDITKRKETEQELRNLSNIDPLTKLPNRSYFQYAHRNLIRRKQPHALLTMDVDNFKKVNDSMGHDEGDKLLCMIAERIDSKIDCQHLLCRLGGDEFALLLEDIDQISMITQVLYEIEVSMQAPFYLNNEVLVMSGSIGVAIYPADGETTENMLQSSDTAMYHAKSDPGFSYQFFDSSMNESAVRRLHIESLIRQALKNDWFEVYYQPKIDVKTRQVTGMEALVRLVHPELGLISPNEFIPIAEDTGLVIAIGEKVLDKACYATQQWRKSGLFNGRVAINLAAKQFAQIDLIQRIDHILECTQLPLANLELEITEGTVIVDPELAIKTMHKLTDKGIHLALDDFGTGYSSLTYLKRFPIHTLKIDKAFIDDLGKEQGEKNMVASIISIAHNMGLSVVAEGVEKEEQVAALEQLNCETIQGFYFSRPLSEDDFTAMLLQHKMEKEKALLV
ncbi:MAG: EAL domain-containing protein [Psychrobium sp.]|nr:EAL domain-containing protein [Psychrobium sp.]